jgi:protein-S-isoprenylcysteine O-methyltransferase Ste14
MLSLFFRNLFFTILQPGIVAGLVPYWILGRKAEFSFSQPWQSYQYLAVLVFLAGLVIMFHCIYKFAVEGQGTLSPADPTKKLVVRGLYKFSRNPMYVGVMLILVGEAVFFHSYDLWVYLLLVFLAFNLFIMLLEEPRLRRDFNQEYFQYCRKVRRWL